MNAPDDIGSPAAPSWPGALARNLRAGFVIALLRAPRDIVASVGQVAWLAVLHGLVAVVTQAAMADFAGEFTWSGVGGALLPVALFAIAAASACALASRPQVALPLTVGMLAAHLWIVVAVSALLVASESVRWHGMWAWAPWVVAVGGLVWIVAAFAVAASRMLALAWGGRVAATLVSAVVVAWPLFETAHDRSVWVRAPDPDERAHRAAVAAAAGESLLYSQPTLLARELESLQPRRPGRPNLYLVGVAGYAGQDVFMREVLFVDALFAERFGTRGRSLRLVNNRTTLGEIPLATRTSLAAALDKVGSLMDRDEDILFLFLTSHGQRGRLLVEFEPLVLADLTPADLRRMLDDAGVRNRVVVVSACYSGGFVEALRDDDTLVITASAAERNSFGCSSEAEFTYFGKAFFDEAMRVHGSFLAAFDAALPAIARREQVEGVAPSVPQRAVGAGIVPRLAAWQASLERDRREAGQAAPR